MAPRRPDANNRRVGAGSSGFAASVARFWMRSYAPEYAGFSVLMVAYLLIQFLVNPFHRMFAVSDLRIAFPHAEVERVPLWLDFVYVLFLPLGLLFLYNWFTSASAHKHHLTILGFAIAMILTPTLTDIVKNAVGRPRPDLLARCKPAVGTPHDVMVGISVCTETSQHLLQDGWRAFPSGHSSFSFAGLGYLALFFAGQFRIFALGRDYPAEQSRRRGLAETSAGNGVGGSSSSAIRTGSNMSEALSGVGVGSPPTHAEMLIRGDLALSLLCFAPLVGAAMIAISRVQDYRHDVYDVCVGAVLGSVVAYWSYRRYWPRLSSARCDEPYEGPPVAAAPARDGDDAGGTYGRIRDEEEGGPDVGLQSVGS